MVTESGGKLQAEEKDKPGKERKSVLPNPEDLISTIPEPIHASGPRLTAWTYEPRWPREGVTQRIVAPIPANKQMATDIAKEGFPSLRSLPDERIFFTLTPRKDFNWSGPKLRIVDSAWESMSQSSARAIAVSVEDTPKDIADREAREVAQIKTVLQGVGSGILAIAAVSLAWSYGRQPSK